MTIKLGQMQPLIHRAIHATDARLSATDSNARFSDYEAFYARSWVMLLRELEMVIAENPHLHPLEFSEEDLESLEHNLDALIARVPQDRQDYLEAATIVDEVLLLMEHYDPSLQHSAHNTIYKLSEIIHSNAVEHIDEMIGMGRQTFLRGMTQANGEVVFTEGSYVIPRADYPHFQKFCTVLKDTEEYFQACLREAKNLRNVEGDTKKREVLGLCIADIPCASIDTYYAIDHDVSSATQHMAEDLAAHASAWNEQIPFSKATDMLYRRLQSDISEFLSTQRALA